MSADIDIDVPDRSKILELIRHTPARQVVDGRPSGHDMALYRFRHMAEAVRRLCRRC